MAQQPAQATEYPIFYRAPRPNRSFTVVGGQGAQPISACPPTSWPPPVAPLVAVATPKANAVQTLSPIESLDMSWPPSCGSSFKSSYSQGPGSGVGSFNRAGRWDPSPADRAARRLHVVATTRRARRTRDIIKLMTGHVTGDSVLGRANLGKIHSMKRTPNKAPRDDLYFYRPSGRGSWRRLVEKVKEKARITVQVRYTQSLDRTPATD